MNEEKSFNINIPSEGSPSQAIIANKDKTIARLKNNLTRREFYKTYRLNGFKPYEAAIKAGYSHEVASHTGTYLEPYCDFAAELIKAGIDSQVVAKRLNDQLNAESIVATRGGIIKDADWVARDKALDKALRFLVPEKKESHKDYGGIQININLTPSAPVIEKPVIELECTHSPEPEA